MAKPSLFEHPKFRRLVHLLGMPEPHVYGHLEYVWRVAYASGNPVIGDEVDVELAAQWRGERGVFAKTLEEVRLLDRHKKTGLLQVHDLHDHAPDYVRSRFRMERFRKRKSREQLRNGYGSNRPEQTRTEQTVPDQSGTEKESAPRASNRKPFTPPTAEEVAAYCSEAGLRMDAQKFVDHFTSNGWKVSGKAPMKDWKAAARNWAKNEKTFSRGRAATFEEQAEATFGEFLAKGEQNGSA